MPGTAKGAANSKWLATLKRCSAEYQQEKGAQPAGAAAKHTRRTPSCACKKKEIDAEIRKEKAAAKTRNAAATKALKVCTAQVTAAIEKTQEPAKRAHREKLAKHVQASQKAMTDEATAKALATVRARRQQAAPDKP
eukprot:14162948-Alexandrium_andersonii.AAC.1